MLDRINTTCPNCGSSALVNYFVRCSDADFDMGYNTVQAECLDCFTSRVCTVRNDLVLELFRVSCKRNSVVQSILDDAHVRYRPGRWQPIDDKFSEEEMHAAPLFRARCHKLLTTVFTARISYEDYYLTDDSIREYWSRKTVVTGVPEFRALSSLILSGNHPVLSLTRFKKFSSALSTSALDTLKWCLVPWKWYSLTFPVPNDSVKS